MENNKFMQEAIKLSAQNLLLNKGWPFGAVVVKGSKIVWKWKNQVTSSNDPTAHAEIQAIRDACKNLKNFDLSGCSIYTSCEPCPMCYSAIYRARIDKIYYANTEKDAAKIWFDDAAIHKDVKNPISKKQIPTKQILREEAIKIFKQRENKKDKKMY
jgi:tRNA(Arg) A34 adenosine deaminase TadA